LLFTEVSGCEKRGERVLTTSFYGFLIVLVSVVVAVAGLMVVRRLVPLPIRERNNTATGTIYAALYTSCSACRSGSRSS